MDIFFLDHIREAVRAQYEHLALADRHFLDLHVHLGLDPERPCDVVLVRCALGLLGRIEAAVDQLLEQRVVHGHLLELVAALAVEARVADVSDGDLVVEEQRRHHRRAHALALCLRVRGLVDDLVRAVDGIAQDYPRARQPRLAVGHRQILALDVLAHQIDDRLHGDATCYLTGVVAPHAVSEHEQANVRIYGNRVLIVFADLTGIREPDEAQLVSQAHAPCTASGPKTVIRVTFPSPIEPPYASIAARRSEWLCSQKAPFGSRRPANPSRKLNPRRTDGTRKSHLRLWLLRGRNPE